MKVNQRYLLNIALWFCILALMAGISVYAVLDYSGETPNSAPEPAAIVDTIPADTAAPAVPRRAKKEKPPRRGPRVRDILSEEVPTTEDQLQQQVSR